MTAQDSMWQGRRVLVTGGASFIGSNLVDALVGRGAEVTVVDDLTSGKRENIATHLDAGRVEFVNADLREQDVAHEVIRGSETVFHLAADHGGRGYVELHQAACAGNLMLDGIVFDACRRTGVEKVIFASSGCVYPNHLQTRPSEVVYLTEDIVGPPYDCDNTYGWAKLMGEMTLKAMAADYGLRSASCRYFTVYGPRGCENHAVIAMIARAFIEQDPFVVWGTGEQIRNWTYVSDIVEGTILAAEHIDDGTAINLGTMERVRVIDAVREVCDYTGFSPKLAFEPDMPTGPLNRVADNSLAAQLLSWKPQVPFREGLHRTIDWYFANKDRAEVRKDFETHLTER